MSDLTAFADHLQCHDIAFEIDDTEVYMSDASFLTLGRPGLVIFPKTERDLCAVIAFAAANHIPLTPRAKGSSTAGASIAPQGQVMVLTDRLGIVNPWGKRLGKPDIGFYDNSGTAVSTRALGESMPGEVYARVGAGLTTDELDKILAPLGWHTAVVPSSGWSTIGGNFSTNAGGNGTPKYGTFRHIVNRLRIIGSDLEGDKAGAQTITDRQIILDMGGGQGLYGIILELDVRIVPDLSADETFCAVCYSTAEDIKLLGGVIGSFMAAMQKVCEPEIAEFMMVDKGLFGADDSLLDDPEIAPLFDYPQAQKRMITMYMGQVSDMQALQSVATSADGIVFLSVSLQAFKKLLTVRKLATGRSPGRVALPGFEDIYVKDPELLGQVLSRIYEITDGQLPGRPIGHQYTGGVVIHYRPQARPLKADYQQAWRLMRELTDEICQDSYKTVKRQEHGLGLEVYALASEEERKKMRSLKKRFDPANIFQPHFLVEKPEIHFVGTHFAAMAEV